ncbi:hypothetical protein ABVT39_003806 [Epinephelus coioides]
MLTSSARMFCGRRLRRHFFGSNNLGIRTEDITFSIVLEDPNCPECTTVMDAREGKGRIMKQCSLTLSAEQGTSNLQSSKLSDIHVDK